MAIKASATITLTSYRDTQSVTRYYKLRPAGSSAPLKPETKPPSSDWTDSEPACDISKELYFCDLTIFSNGEWEYSTVSKSTSYEAAKQAYNRADNAQTTANEALKGSKENATQMAQMVVDFNGDIKNLQDQIDGNIATWFYDVDPAMNLPPVTNWDTDKKKDAHLGDIYYNTVKGYAWRFMKSGSTYSWERITDTDVTKALADAAKAQDTADSKRRIFYNTPTVPYDAGDLWVQGSGGDILRCAQAKTSTGSYDRNDWVLASKYTDNSALNTWIEGDFATTIRGLEEGLVDAKVETYYQTTDPSTGWSDTQKSEHEGDLWYNNTASVQKYYRWSGTAWQELTATPPQAVFDNIDKKATIYTGTTTPTNPDSGDLWFKGADEPILTYVNNSWVEYNKYTDDSAVNNLEIGGRNLFLGTKDFSGSKWSNSSSLKYYNDSDIKYAKLYSSPTTPWTTYIRQYLPLDADTEYILSALIRKNTDEDITVGWRYDSTEVTNNFITITSKKWTRVVFPYRKRINAADSEPIILFVPANSICVSAETAIDVAYIKFEKGNKATDWTPAPEDVDAGIANAATTATNYIHSDDTNGLVVNNNQTVGVGYDVQLKANGSDTGMNIRQDGNILASFLQNSVSLGKNSISSKVGMCGDKGGVSASFGYYIDSVSSNNAEMGSTLDFDFNETTFKNKVGQEIGFYDFSYTSADGWTLFDYVNDTSYPVTLSQYGITLRTPTPSLNDHAQIVIKYVLDGSVKFYNADISNPVRKLELEMAENPSSSESDYANITIERQSGTYANGDGKEHSIITMMTLHEFANVATLQLFDDSISLDATHVHLTSTHGEGSIQLNGDTNINGDTKIWGQFQVVNLAGEIKMWAGNEIPYGWLLCDGSEVSKTDYPELYGAIGDLWGVPNNSSNFKLPNLTGRVPVGYNAADTDTTETFGQVGATGGARGAWYHTHTIGSSGAHHHASQGRMEGSGTGANIFESYNGASKTRTVNVPRTGDNGAHTHSPGASGSAGNKLAVDKANMPPYAVVKYIICAF